MDYKQAQARAESGKALLVSLAGGRKRYAKFANDNGVVRVTLFKTEIAEFHPEHVVVRTGGWNTATTREALNTLMAERGRFWTTKQITSWYPFGGEPTVMTEGMAIGYDGDVQRDGSEPSPLSEDSRAYVGARRGESQI